MSDLAYENTRDMFNGKLPDVVDPPLSDEEKRDVLSREDHGVTDPVNLYKFKDLDEFKKHQNNFYVHFASTNPKSMAGNLYKTERAFQRFEILYPDLTEELLGKFSPTSGISEDQWQKLYDAYQKMSTLVDRKDAGIAAEIQEGESEENIGYYLCT
jgi:hypothetical protein